jgi:hypothetical protein
MTPDRSIINIVLVSIIVMVLPAALYFRTLPEAELSATEKELMNFTFQPVASSSIRSQDSFSGLANPVKSTAIQNRNSSGRKVSIVPASKAVSRIIYKGQPRSLSSLPAVSMIYYADSTRMAIIDNHVVREGSSLEGAVIVRIEKNRVLMRKAGKDLWLTTE